jgi:hypothetical protein
MMCTLTAMVRVTLLLVLTGLVALIAFAVVDPCAWHRADLQREVRRLAPPRPPSGFAEIDEINQRSERRLELRIDGWVAERGGPWGCAQAVIRYRLGWPAR